jgi:hypothetical protein
MAFLKSIGKKLAEKAPKGALESVAKKAPRMSEALNPHVGKRLYITQADRTALDYDQGLLGGPGYTELATIDPAKYKDIAWAVQSPGVAKTLVGSMARNPEEAVFSNLIGSPEQHRSNKVVFDRIMDRFEKAVEEDKLTPELHQTINKRLANIKDPKTGKSFFPKDVDILSPEFNQHAQTFHQRAYIADILAGKGVGGKKGSIIDYPQVIKETTDPLLLEAKTGDIGDRLFSLSGNIQERPELHPAFHYSLSGKKESEAFAPAPQGIVLKNFTKDFTERTGRLPTYYDLTRGYAPSEKVTDEMLERMYKEGYAEGGTVADDAEEYGEQLKEQRKTLGSDILKSGAKGITEGVGNILRSAKETLSRAGTLGDIAKIPVDPLLGKMQYEAVTGKKFPELKPISLLPEQSITESPVGAKILPFTTEGQQFAGEVLGDPLSYSVSGAGRGIKKIGQFVGKGLAEAEATGKGPVGKIMQTIVPRMNILPERGVNLGVDFFRPSEDTIRGHKMDAIPGSQWYSWLQSNAPKSSKKELEASGTMNWLKDSQEKISKNDIINHLRENEPNLRSKTYSSYETHPYEVIGDAESGNYDVVDSSMGDTVISSHGDQGDAYMAMEELANEMYPMTKYKQYTLPGGEEYREIVIQDKPKVWSKNKKFESSHYPEATNPIAHLRVNHRDDADGNPTLFIEELQSDWGQKGKKEGFGQKQLPTDMSAEDLLNNYRDNLSQSQKNWLNRFIGQWESVDAYNNVPNQTQKLDELTDLYQNWVKSQEFGVSRNPYVEDTKDWTALALKQAIKEAVDNGKTQVAWTTGIQQAERYDLSKRLSSVSLHPREDGQFTLNAYDHDGRRAIQELVTEDNLDNYIGKDLANKLLAVKTHTEKPFTQAEHRLLDHYMEVGKKNLSEDEIKDFDRLMDQANKNKEANIRRLDGLDIKTEHKGMQGYYDNILPQVANDVIKQLGGKNKVKTIRVKQGDATYALRNKTTGYDVGGGYSYEEAKQAIKENPNREMYKVSGGDSDQLGFEITPDMIKFIKEDAGIPKFKKGGSIDLQQEYKLENMRRRYG